ncbi:MAG TPA: fumarylacetoacetate hydrolase family protein [Thermoplasmata archaeon]|nr:fumarylacetoacetate hydrolase family protein [Thermoplasmata archaeon]
MKLVTFSKGREAPRLGAALGPWDAWEAVVDLHGIDRRLPTEALDLVDAAGTLSGGVWRRAQTAVRGAQKALVRARPSYAHDPGRVRLHPPLRPRLLRDFIAFRGHIARTRASRGEKVPEEWDRVPAYYNGNHLNLVGPGDVVPFPHTASFGAGVWKRPLSQKLDYELEIGYVVAATTAAPHLFGVTIFNDFSMRDLQGLAGRVGMGPAAGKDWANALGPCLVTRDEFGPLKDKRVAVRVNGVQRLAGRLRDLVTRNPLLEPGQRTAWSFQELATFLAATQTVHAGEVWGSGTIPGGCEFEKGDAAAYLMPGDAVELEVEGIGVLANAIAAVS